MKLGLLAAFLLVFVFVTMPAIRRRAARRLAGRRSDEPPSAS